MNRESSSHRRFNTCVVVFALFVLTTQVFAEWQSVGNVTRASRSKTNGVILDTTSRARVMIEFFDLDVVRIRLAPSGIFERDFSYAIDYSLDRHTPVSRLTQTPREIALTNYTGTRVLIARAPLSIRIVDDTGRLVFGDDPARPTGFDRDACTGSISNSWARCASSFSAPCSRITS